jgi:hypothetical protein
MVMSSTLLETKNYCAGEDQQQCTPHIDRPNRSALSYIVSSRYLSTIIEQTEDFTRICAVVIATNRVCKSVRVL